MTAVHFHLIANHLPILGVLFGLPLLLSGLLRKSRELKVAAMITFLLCGLAIIPVYQTGEGAEESVEDKPEVTRALIHEHEESAELSLILTEVLAVASLGGLVWTRRGGAGLGYLEGVVLVAALVAGASLVRTGALGGEIRHSEIRASAAPATPAAAPEWRSHDD